MKKHEYNHIQIEKKWQKEWEAKKTYKTENPGKKKKYYVLDMFPYPSGAGLHVGHPRGYIGSDVFARMKRMQGFNVLHPMGYDAFGLPAEQYAIEHKIHPRKAVEKNVATFERQLSVIGLSYDWSRKVNTTDPEYYKWTQWIFLQIYNSWYDNAKNKARPVADLVKLFEKSGNEKTDAACDADTKSFSAQEWKSWNKVEQEKMLMKYRLTYEGYSEVNWCPEMGTVLANDEIVDGPNGPVSERGGFPVEKKSMRQWFMRITAYADRLLTDLEALDWSSHIKEIQKNWIGKSEGSEITFKVVFDGDFEPGYIPVFTTRADTLFGVTYVVLSPEHPWVTLAIDDAHKEKGVLKNTDEVRKYVAQAKKKSEEDRKNDEKEKTGVLLKGVKAVNPANGEEVPIWVADYVLANYGTGAVMAVPAHDERDFEFAKKYDLPIKKVIARETGQKRENEEFRDGGAAVIFDPETQKYAVSEFSDGKILLFAGGVDKGESVYDGVLREVQEESGLYDFKHSEWIESSYAHYFNTLKKVNRFARAECLLVILNSSKTKPTKLEEHEKFVLGWKTAEEIKTYWETHNDEDGLKHYIRFLDESVARAIELGYDTTSNAQKFKSTCLIDYGILEASGKFTGLTSQEAKKKITEAVNGKIVTKYKMRDAVFARQRYWGEPIPLVHEKDGTITALKEKSLPLTLPNVTSYEPMGTGESPLASVKAWIKAGYETNTMPGWAGSSWYFLRYMDPKNKKAFADKKALNYWKDVDMYVGGQEHATGHLLYSRFWHKFLFDIGEVPTKEPFKTLKNQGIILATDGRKMSKRWGNVINPDEIVQTYGADTLRVYEMFMGPFEASQPWSTESIIGSRRFIEKVWRLGVEIASAKNDSGKVLGSPRGLKPSRPDHSQNHSSPQLEKLLHKTIKKVTEDILNFNFNTAISSMMIFVNAVGENDLLAKDDFKKFLQILAPFASHMTEELWSELGEKKSIHLSLWPKYDAKKIVDDEMKIMVQVNGKVRAELMVSASLNEEEVKSLAQENDIIKKWTEGKTIVKVIYVKGRLVNIVVA